MNFPGSLSVIFALLCALFSLGACEKNATPFDESTALYPNVSGEKAFQHVASLVKFGPRPAGSEALEESRLYLIAALENSGWSVRRQTFEKQTPDGKVTFVNLRARFGKAAWNRPVTGLLCSHYDTKKFSFEFVGANDGGSSTGLLLELGDVLSKRPELAQQIELVFFDGEEAFGTRITTTDGLYGSKYYALDMLLTPVKKRPKWGVLLDMIGDKDLNVRAAVQILSASIRELQKAEQMGHDVDIRKVKQTLETMSKQLLSAADDLKVRSKIGISPDFITDDHIPLNTGAGIPTINLIDFDYGNFWHNPGDTIDQISAESLDTVGKVTLLFIEKYLIGKQGS